MRKRRPNKYGAIKTTVDGHKFDSKAEARRYTELVLFEKAGHIIHLSVHPRYMIHDEFTDGNDKVWRPIMYEPDFYYLERTQDGEWETVAEDVKGKRTAVFRIKEKMFRKRYPHIDLRILEV